jgi:hypothetical protein
VGPWLTEVEGRGGGQRRRGVRLYAPMYKEQSRLVTPLHLRDVCLTVALRLPAVLSLVASPPVVVEESSQVALRSSSTPPGAPPRTLSRLRGRHLRLLDEAKAKEPEASLFVRSRWQASHCSSVKK